MTAPKSALFWFVAFFVWPISASAEEPQQSAAVVKLLRDNGAKIEWVTEEGFVAGHQTPLAEKDCYYFAMIDADWKGGSVGLVQLGQIPRLKRLTLADSREVKNEWLANLQLPHIERCEVRSIEIDDLQFLSSMRNLKSLSVSLLPVADTGLNRLRELKELQSINLGLMPKIASVAALEKLPNLRSLVLARSGITDAGLEHLNPGLEELNLFGTQVSDEALKWVKQLKRLRSLNLNQTQVTDEGLILLAGLPELKILQVGRTNVTETGMLAFKEARKPLPPVELEWSE